MELLLTKSIETLILPPGLFLSLALFGLLIKRRFYKTGKTFIFASFILLYLLSTPLISGFLISTQEDIPALDISQLANTQAKAIVILGGGRYSNAPEYQSDTVSSFTLERIRYGAYLQRKSRLPILTSGGSFYDDQQPEAILMKQVLEDAFISIVHWAEGKSRTTYENAIESYALLSKENIQHIILVTHSLHMKRSKEAFEKAGFTVTAAPTKLYTPSTKPILVRLLPSATSLYNSRLMLHELVGRLWYHLRYY